MENSCRPRSALDNSLGSIIMHCKHIANQEEHHRLRPFREEFDKFLKKAGINIIRVILIDGSDLRPLTGSSPSFSLFSGGIGLAASTTG